jgi:hypothetical protein
METSDIASQNVQNSTISKECEVDILVGYTRANFRALQREGGHGGRSWLRHYATRWKVAGSSPGWDYFFFNLPNHSSLTMALGSTQSLTEMSTRNLTGSKSDRRVGWQPHRHLWAECLIMWETQPLATLRASTACTGITLPLPCQERGMTVNSVRYSKKLQDKFKLAIQTQSRGLLSKVSHCCTIMPVRTLPPTPLNVSQYPLHSPGLAPSIACLLHSKMLWEATISPVTKKWNKRRMRGLSLNQKQLFLRAYRSLWTAGRSVVKRTGTI